MPPSNHIPKSKSNPSPFRNLPPPTAAFIAKKQKILDSLSVPDDTYTDKSPKGSIDTPIIDLINELNSLDGVVTTSSCSGRVAVFVEGARPNLRVKEIPSLGNGNRDEDGDVDSEADDENGIGNEGKPDILTGSPSGKGSGHWLFVSHDPITIPANPPTDFFTKLCGFPSSSFPPTTQAPPHPPTDTFASSPRLIKLSFSPLILHIHCSSLQHAKLLLTAAISAGFRESGVQSLRVLDDEDAGVALGIRTMGLGFETVVGQVRDSHVGSSVENEGLRDRSVSLDIDVDANQNGKATVDSSANTDDTTNTTTTSTTPSPSHPQETHEPLVSEPYLTSMFNVINERFAWNLRRKERFRSEVQRLFGHGAGSDWEDGDVRRRRMREEGLRRKRELIDYRRLGNGEEGMRGGGVGGGGRDREMESSELVTGDAVGISGMFDGVE